MNQSSSEARLEAMRRFRGEIAELAVSDADDLVRYLSLAARLESLGEGEPLRNWPKAAQGTVNATSAVLARVAEIERELLECEGELLGLAVCLVQDLRIAIARDPSGFLEDLAGPLDRLGELADDTPLDDEAAEVVVAYAELVPVPPELRLGHVADPVGLGAIAAVAARVPDASPIVPLERRERNSAVEEEELALCAGVAPAESLRKRFENRHACAGELAGGTRVEAWARLHDDWSMAISVRISGGQRLQAVSVRVGTCPADRDGQAEGMFLIEMVGLSPDARSRLLVEPIVVTLSDGRRVSF